MREHFFARTPVDELYRWFADEAAPSSPRWEATSHWVADESRLHARLDALPGEARQPNRFLAALRFHGAPTRPGDELLRWVDEHWAELETTIRTRPTQTNEPGRLAALAPVLASLPGPLALLELGSAAGIGLLPDVLDTRDRAETTGTPPSDRLPEVAARLGVDRNPLDVSDPGTVRWLRALVWPGEEDRERGLVEALELVARHRPEIRPLDLTRDPGRDLPALVDELRRRAPGATPVVTHAMTLGYLARPQRRPVVDAVRASGAHWVAFEPPRVLRGLVDDARVPLAVAERDCLVTLDGEVLAVSQPHGRRVDWR